MNVLVLGSGGREHAISWKIAQSSQIDKLFIAPGNAGTNQAGTNVDIQVSDFEGIKKLCLDEKVDFVLFAGDIFNNAIPSLDLVEKVVVELMKLKENIFCVFGQKRNFQKSLLCIQKEQFAFLSISIS